jgi:hypothetical protein
MEMKTKIKNLIAEIKSELESLWYVSTSWFRFRFYRIKFGVRKVYQRAKYGYSKSDVWEFFNWYLDIIPKMLKDLEKGNYGHPYDMTPEEWDDYLHEICTCLNTVKQIDTTEENSDKVSTREEITALEQEKREWLHKAFELMEKRFFDLWD